jgi:formamidopyrimidine-DNA glycosylase
MPELPDVEGFRRFLAGHAHGRKVTGVDVLDPPLVRNRTSRSFERALVGHRFGTPRRHGKWLIAPLGDAEVLIHFGMTGGLAWAPGAQGRHPHDRIIFVCEGGELRYNNMRRFGGIWLARKGDERDRITGPLGPDAAALDWAEFGELLARRRGGIKAALMDQRLVAGLGNLMCDEILWRACVHPRTELAELGSRRRKRIYEALRAVVSESSRYGRVPHGQRWLTRVRDDRQAVCPRCGSRLRWATVAGRTACWCPRCQRAP